ncbi:tripartite tricarboxylate transporter substrate binding protein [Ramlibacter sp. WS9]|uniref:Bug family tripartite tricarboxylate transporter substrate binding protein n=1 Tax=Ramlibacter sp. WS9 TaxID=1882741 RepID=UPI001142AFDA|nr:tripartite tricarboxylate transporter substrate binding protein [Ramlibacter sp. WS9]ROZ78120.1 tripartite tricarboxylate transporter substrate binding protein [Ramlibacter sp. WS9]HSV36711.1 tripartite tricarboxylate transporter substrate binding protein [Ramlibacter sp.]
MNNLNNTSVHSAALDNSRRELMIGIAATLVAGVPGLAAAQADWPTGPIRIIVPQGTGGGLDSVARILTKGLGEELKQPVIVDNKPGASGNIGAELVAKAKPDGLTVLLAVNQMVTMVPHLVTTRRFNPEADLVPVTQVSMGAGYILAVTNSLPVRSLNELVQYGQRNPNKLSFGSYGVGTSHHMCAEFLMSRAGFPMVHVPYSRSPSLDLMSGQIHLLFDSHVALQESIRAGNVRAIAVTSPGRSPVFPQVPAISETYPGFEVVGWHGLWAPKGTPQPIVDRLRAAVVRVLQTEEVRRPLKALSLTPKGTSGQEMARLISVESAMWGDTIRKAGIKAQL